MSKMPMTCRIKRSFRSALLATALTFCAAAIPSGAHAQRDTGGMPGDFDYYVMALSWSPTYCSGQGGGNDADSGDYERGYDSRRYGRWRGNRQGDGEQCNGIRPYAFVLHGLWPQYERRGWPEMCETGERPWVSEDTIERMLDIMPSRHLIINEYKKHGVCSGLDPRHYFDAARKAYRSIRIPDGFQDLTQPLTLPPEDVRKSFLDANPQLAADSMQITCSRNLLREVRICLTKDLEPRPCSRSEQTRRLCPSNTVTMPPVRGGGTGPHGGPSYGRGDNL
jgi:ribonuclease T2